MSGYVQNGLVDEARETFEQMPQRNIVSWNAMIAGYVQCKRRDMARKLCHYFFDRMPRRNLVSWAAMIAGYAQSGYSEEALRLFVDMKRDGERLNRSSFASALSTCAHIAALELGMQLHGQLVKAGYKSGSFVGNALLLMYCKCGVIEAACSAFEEIMEKDIFSWNTMISGYAIHGFAGFKPDDTTMVRVLSACSHAGLVDRGMEYFYSMNQDYGITAILQHYNCMVDLLGRAGRLD
ncbi:pentatricopeptide repeat-containing protein [Gossypium australe]|uniref:Pentatricopeptide repeat-containing protein n=1 Tax=Gossypium australe TaxID=47621 RepID=A0A5B6UQM4_9ROSI|nr:pentatricopeptide repeat-containing protein [Gossypium australe]